LCVIMSQEKSSSTASRTAAARLSRVRKHSGKASSSSPFNVGRTAKRDEDEDCVSRLTDFQIEEFREAFRVFDTDGSGNIDKSELKKLMSSVGQNPDDAELEEMIRIADADGSGEIDFFEFVALMAHKMADPVNTAAVKMAFELFDKDNDGKLGFKELQGLLLNVGEPTTIEDVKTLLSEVDYDGNGEIDASEFSHMILKDQMLQQTANSLDAKAKEKKKKSRFWST
jgi:Ca2+-binding EF-hand superfamily protein